ncbi:MAG TPA: hypothetical protein VG184_11365 [Acidimicrobiales bacterium]|jgi:hypothetical protein|nr:hypothetical protein [Acidimicrobiales bacterium]
MMLIGTAGSADAARSDREVERHRLAVGELLAEGGEGRVHTLEDRADLVYKAFKVPVAKEAMRALVRWLDQVTVSSPALAARVRSASAWPVAVVADGRSDLAAGLLVPRAPERFRLRHRDGAPRLATLSYLTADPGQRAAAYGLALPPPMDPARLGIAYALARLLDALGGASPAAAHGDLSAKNVLWSLERGPEVYVIDCDNTELFGADGTPVTTGRRRPMTPNWDDPAIAAGASPDLSSDRYSLALIFLRIVGAAHFPIQLRQRRGETVAIDFEVPGGARRLPSLDRSAPLWRLVARGLSTAEPRCRPGAAEWSHVLEQVLTELGATQTLRQVWAAQEGVALAEPTPAPPPPSPSLSRAVPGDVFVRPVAPTPRTQAWRIATSRRADEDDAGAEAAPIAVARRYARYALVWWWLAHRRMLRTLVSRGRHLAGARRAVFLLFVDFALACVSLFLVAMIVSPFLGL